MNPFVLMKAKKILSLISLIATFLSAAIGIYENIAQIAVMRMNQQRAA